MLTSLLQHFKSFLLKHKCPTPLLFFSCYALLHFYHEQQLLWLVHVLAIFLLLWRNYNMLYMLPTFIYFSSISRCWPATNGLRAILKTYPKIVTNDIRTIYTRYYHFFTISSLTHTVGSVYM